VWGETAGDEQVKRKRDAVRYYVGPFGLACGLLNGHSIEEHFELCEREGSESPQGHAWPELTSLASVRHPRAQYHSLGRDVHTDHRFLDS
jgi:hypothetical protein